MSSLITTTLTPVGFGVTPVGALGAPSPLLADNIDPTTHDYVSLTVGVDPIDAQVINALKISRASGAAVLTVGNQFAQVRKMTRSVNRELESLVRIALKRLIDNEDITYVGTEFDTIDFGTATVEMTVQWINRRSFSGVVTSITFPYTIGGI